MENMVATPKAIENLKTNKSGSSFLHSFDIVYFALFYLAMWLFFFLMFKLSKYLHQKYQPKWFKRLDVDTQEKWIGASVSHLHSAIIVISLSYLWTHSICENSYNFIWFFDENCFLTMDQRFIYCSLVTASYCSHDYYYLKYVIRTQNRTV